MSEQVTACDIFKNARKSLNMSLRDFAAVLGVSHNAVALYERGETTPDDDRIASWLKSEMPAVRGMALELTRARFNHLLNQAQPITP